MRSWQATWIDDLDGPEALALRAVGFIVAHPPTLDSFVAEAGVAATELERRPLQPTHLAAVLDFVIAHEAVLQEFADRLGVPPEAAYEARRLCLGLAAPSARLAVLVP